MGQIKIEESEINLTHNRKGKVAILMHSGDGDPVNELDLAVHQYVGNELHMQFVDINMDNPWVRVIISGINEMEQENFDPTKHGLKK